MISADNSQNSWTKEKVLTIQTPEGVTFPLLIASPLSRFLALAIDRACIMVVTSTASIAIKLLGIVAADFSMALFAVSSFVVSVGYPIFLEWRWRGQTIGKRIMRIQVVDEQGLQMQFSQIMVRNLLRAIDMLPLLYLVGGASCFLSLRGQRLGDIAANTIVIYNPKISEPDIEQLMSDKYNTFKDHPHLAARLRQEVTPREAGIALRALMRRDSLSAEARLKLFAGVKEHMERYVTFPAEATDGISDEQYVRNVVDILFK